jgi:ATP phosphoribosyltransferase
MELINKAKKTGNWSEVEKAGAEGILIIPIEKMIL